MDKIRAVFFDLDDTLYHFEQLDGEALECAPLYVSQAFGINQITVMEVIRQAKSELGESLGIDNPAFHNRQIRFQNAMALLNKPLYPYAMQVRTNLHQRCLRSVRRKQV